MSLRYNGSYISANTGRYLPVTSYPSIVSGIWTLQQQYNLAKTEKWPTLIYENITLTTGGVSPVTITGNGTSNVSFYRASGTAAWDTQAYCATPFTAPCTIEYNKTAASTDNGVSYAMISWNADPTTDANYTSLDWASYAYATSNYQVYNNGTASNYVTTWDPNKKFYLVYDTDGIIKHYNGNILIASFLKGTGGTVYLDTSLYSPNATFASFNNVRIIKRAWNGTRYN